MKLYVRVTWLGIVEPRCGFIYKNSEGNRLDNLAVESSWTLDGDSGLRVLKVKRRIL